MKIDLYQADAFTGRLFGGNPAAVCPLEQWLPEELMQKIAEENNLSETAFFVHTDGSYELRWFTPETEVELCGHATLASAHILFSHLGYGSDTIYFETKSGELTVKKDGELLVMNFPSNPPAKTDFPDRMEEALGVKPSESYKAMDYLFVLETEQQVKELDPDFFILKQMDTRGVIVSAPGEEVDFVSRFFAPAVGINEDPVTGSAHTTLAPYWADRLGKNKLKARQVSRRGGKIFCSLNGDRVDLGGRAQTYMKGIINLPE